MEEVMIRKGDKITLKPEYRDGGETFQYVAASDEEKGRVDIVAVDSALPHPPINTVRVDMLEGR
jgi:hypothetical protein